MKKKAKVAILFRYGAGEHVHFLPCLPALVREMAGEAEVHHVGFRGEERFEMPGVDLRVHVLPWRVRRGEEGDKRRKTALWLLLLPWVGLWLRVRGFQAVFVDETLPLSVPLLRLGFGGAVGLTVHDSFLEMYAGGRRWAGWVRRLDVRALRGVERVFVRVEAARRHVMALGVAAERIVVAHDPANLVLFAPGDRAAARAAWGYGENDFVLVHHGVMHPNKGNERIVRAVARLRERVPGLRLLLIGEGPEAERVAALIEELGVGDRVRCAGWLGSLREVAQALQSADAGLAMRAGLPGDHFHVTSTLVHNLACGLPVVAARLEGMMEVVTEGREGFLVDPECGEEFDAAVLRLAGDAELRARMGAAARETAERCFDPERIGRVMAEGLLSLIQGRVLRRMRWARR